MTTKILSYDFPLHLPTIQEDIDGYINKGYVYVSDMFVPEHSVGNSTYYPQLIITLHRYTTNIMSGPYTFNIGGDI